PEWHDIRLGTRQDRTAQIGLISRLGHDHYVARVGYGKDYMRQTFLRSNQRNELGDRIEPHTEPAFDPARRCLPEFGQALLKSVFAESRLANGRRHALDGEFGRRGVVVTRTDVDYVHALVQEPALERRQLGHGVPGKRF